MGDKMKEGKVYSWKEVRSIMRKYGNQKYDNIDEVMEMLGDALVEICRTAPATIRLKNIGRLHFVYEKSRPFFNGLTGQPDKTNPKYKLKMRFFKKLRNRMSKNVNGLQVVNEINKV